MSLASAKIAMIEKVSENSITKGILNRVPFFVRSISGLPEPAVFANFPVIAFPPFAFCLSAVVVSL